MCIRQSNAHTLQQRTPVQLGLLNGTHGEIDRLINGKPCNNSIRMYMHTNTYICARHTYICAMA